MKVYDSTRWSVLGSGERAEPGLDRGRAGEHERLEKAVRTVVAAPEPASLLGSWQRLAALGRRDLVLGRLSEGHVDAVGILAEAGRAPVPGAVYGVWASRSEGTGLAAECHGDGWRLSGSLRFATGAGWIDRALVTALLPDQTQVLVDVETRGSGWRVLDGSWPAVGMDLSESFDMEVDAEVPTGAEVGAPGFYLDRPGFSLGGIGVAAVWLGGAAGVLDAIVATLRTRTPDPHQLAHLATMHAALSAADATLARAAAVAEGVTAGRASVAAQNLTTREAAKAGAANAGAANAGAANAGAAHAGAGGAVVAQHPALDDLARLALEARGVVDAAVRVVLDRAPRLTGPTPLCRDADFAHRMADLLVYERQHHAERDLEALGRALLA